MTSRRAAGGISLSVDASAIPDTLTLGVEMLQHVVLNTGRIETPDSVQAGLKIDAGFLTRRQFSDQHILIVDRLFGAAELRLGSGDRQQTVRIVRTDGRASR